MKSSTLANIVRKDIIKMINSSGASHVASCLSVVDILTVLYNDVLDNSLIISKDINRDRVILSKGHAGAAVYASLANIGYFDKKLLDTYYKDGSLLSGHVSHKNVPGVEISTGSLGHGPSLGVGFALSAKLDNRKSKVYVICGDGELNEGSIWEACLFASTNKLDNFTLIIDRNNMQALGKSEDIIKLESIKDKFEAFGFTVFVVDGHNYDKLKSAYLKSSMNKPKCIIANTIKGKGISFMENELIWHYRNLNDEDFLRAMKELEEK